MLTGYGLNETPSVSSNQTLNLSVVRQVCSLLHYGVSRCVYKGGIGEGVVHFPMNVSVMSGSYGLLCAEDCMSSRESNISRISFFIPLELPI